MKSHHPRADTVAVAMAVAMVLETTVFAQQAVTITNGKLMTREKFNKPTINLHQLQAEAAMEPELVSSSDGFSKGKKQFLKQQSALGKSECTSIVMEG